MQKRLGLTQISSPFSRSLGVAERKWIREDNKKVTGKEREKEKENERGRKRKKENGGREKDCACVWEGGREGGREIEGEEMTWSRGNEIRKEKKEEGKNAECSTLELESHLITIILVIYLCYLFLRAPFAWKSEFKFYRCIAVHHYCWHF